MLISSNAFSCDPSGCGVIQYLKYDTVSEGSYTPGAARSCVNDSFFFFKFISKYTIYNITNYLTALNITLYALLLMDTV